MNMRELMRMMLLQFSYVIHAPWRRPCFSVDLLIRRRL